MSLDSVRVLKSNEIQTLSTKVTQQIHSKYLNDFVKTSLEENQISYENNSKYYSTFIEENLSYEIIVINSSKKENIVLEPFIFQGYYNLTHTIQSIDLFLLNDFFVLYKNKQFITFKNIANASAEDVKLYISQIYHLTIDNIVVVDDNEYEKIKNNYFKSYYKAIKYQKLTSKIEINFMAILTLCSVLTLGYLLYDRFYIPIQPTDKTIDISKNIKLEQTKKLQTIYNKHNQKSIATTVELFKYLKLNKITIIDITYQQSYLQILINHHDKQKLLNLLTIYDDIIVTSIAVDKTMHRYQMNAKIKVENRSSISYSLEILKQNIIKKDINSIIKIIETESLKREVIITLTNIDKNSIEIKFNGKFKNVINLLNYFENHFIINGFTLNKQSSQISSTVTLSTKYMYNPSRKTSDLENLANPFVNIIKKTKLLIKSKPLIISAIVNDEVIIQNIWYKRDDIITNQKIIGIDLNQVKFLDLTTKEIYILKVHNEQ